MATQTMTSSELESFANKLESFGLGLLPKERALLLEILSRAAIADVDVEGHSAASASSLRAEIERNIQVLLGEAGAPASTPSRVR